MLAPRRSHGAAIGVSLAPPLRGREPSVEVERGSVRGDLSAPGTPIEFSSSSGALSWWGLSAGAPAQLGGLACVGGTSRMVHGSLWFPPARMVRSACMGLWQRQPDFVLLLLWAPVRP